jgi:hypothetical protein
MKYINSYKLFEEKEHFHYYVVIEWEHGDADGKSLQRYPFKSEDEMDDFLHFIYDIRKFIPNSAWANAGHFEDGHYQRERKWIDEIDKKYGGRFSQLVPSDNSNRNRGDRSYTPAVNSIWVEQDGLPLNIVWEKALRTNIINLPKIGDKIKTNTGHISYYGPRLWGKTDMEYWGYDAFKHWDEDFQCKECNGKGWVKDYDRPSTFSESGYYDKKCTVCKGEHRYSEIEPTVTDCRINVMEPYKREKWDREGQKVLNSYLTYSDYTSFQYILLCEFAGAYITTTFPGKGVGFDPNFESKYHYTKYGTNDFYLVR